jgi:hypothetical protein
MNRVDAKGLSREIDRDASDWSVEKLHRTFLKYGCAIVRNIINHETLSAVQNAISKSYERVNELHVYDSDIRTATAGVLSGFELVNDAQLLRDFLSRVYAGQSWREYSVSARRIQGPELKENWQQPLELHLDSQFHSFAFTTNFWIPFQDCGVDAPSVQFLPVDYRTTRGYAGYSETPSRIEEKWHLAYFRDGAFEPGEVTKAFGDECFIRPVMKPGDVIIASNWIIHGSYRTPQMTKGRTSVEVRFIGESIDIQAAPTQFQDLVSQVRGALGI